MPLLFAIFLVEHISVGVTIWHIRICSYDYRYFYIYSYSAFIYLSHLAYGVT